MDTTKRSDLIAAGMAIFAMYFGAGNIIFPLALGQFALDKTPYAMMGLLLTAVLMPFMGLIAMFLYKGDIALFFGRLGKIPGFLLALFTISLLGPLGCGPRCIVLAHSTVNLSIPGISLIYFSLVSCVLLFLFIFNKGRLLSLIGYVLSPFKISLLVLVILLGIVNAPTLESLTTSHDETMLFLHGLKEGYNTLDLIASFFFAPVIIVSLASTASNGKEIGLNSFTLTASCIGAALLAIIYVGFCYLAYIYAPELQGIPSDQLLGVIAIKVLGQHGGLLVSITVALACFTTAVAVIAAFANFVHKEMFKERIQYSIVVIGSLLITFFVTTLEFQGIAAFLAPVLEMCYPILILLTVYNLIHGFFFQKETSAQKVS